MSDIVLKDKSGVKNTYNNINAINIPDGNGGFVKYSLGGTPLPEYDGAVIIEKAESVLGLRRFKETIDLDTLPNLDGASGVIADFTCQDIAYALMISINLGDGTTYLSYYTSDSTRVDVYSATTGWQNEAYRTVNITKCDDENAIAWLLANTEGVSV